MLTEETESSTAISTAACNGKAMLFPRLSKGKKSMQVLSNMFVCVSLRDSADRRQTGVNLWTKSLLNLYQAVLHFDMHIYIWERKELLRDSTDLARHDRPIRDAALVPCLLPEKSRNKLPLSQGKTQSLQRVLLKQSIRNSPQNRPKIFTSFGWLRFGLFVGEHILFRHLPGKSNWGVDRSSHIIPNKYHSWDHGLWGCHPFNW